MGQAQLIACHAALMRPAVYLVMAARTAPGSKEIRRFHADTANPYKTYVGKHGAGAIKVAHPRDANRAAAVFGLFA
jgi:hypothetical protein